MARKCRIDSQVVTAKRSEEIGIDYSLVSQHRGRMGVEFKEDRKLMGPFVMG